MTDEVLSHNDEQWRTAGQPKDWRGTAIEIGDVVIYGAPVGRSIALVEAEVVGYTTSGRVNVRIIRRAYGGNWSDKEVVHVGADRLVVVTALPPSDVPLTSEVIAERRARDAEHRRIHNSHDWPPPYQGVGPGGWYQTVRPPCTRCGRERWSPDPMTECPR